MSQSQVTPFVTALVNEQIQALSSICELESDVTQAFRSAIYPIAEKHFETFVSQSGTTPKFKIDKKVSTKKAAKPKEENLSKKNAYHFFVAEKMALVKADGVESKLRMKRIGEMWKELNDDQRRPFREKAEVYNAYIAKAMQEDPNWKTNKDAILAGANSAANGNLDDTALQGVDEAEYDDAASVVTTTTTATGQNNALRRKTKAK